MLRLLMLAIVLTPGVARAESPQLARQEVEQIVFDFREGVDYRVKMANIERLTTTREMYVPLLIECLQWKLPAWLTQRMERLREQEGRGKIRLSSDGGVHEYVGIALTRIGASAVPLLVASLESQPETRGRVVRILGDIGDARAIPPLIAILKDKNQNLGYRYEVAYGLQMLDAQDAVPHLIDVLGEQPDSAQRSDTLRDTVATALAELTDQSFGFMVVVYKPDMTWDMTPRYTFVCVSDAREHLVTQWKHWWDRQGELRARVKTCLTEYAAQLRNRSEPGAKVMRSDDYVRRIRGRKGRLIVVDSPDGEWFDALQRPRGSPAGCKDYQISILNCRDEGERVVVTTQDTALLMVDNGQVSFTVTVERVLKKQGDSLIVSEENLLKWERPVYGG